MYASQLYIAIFRIDDKHSAIVKAMNICPKDNSVFNAIIIVVCNRTNVCGVEYFFRTLTANHAPSIQGQDV